MISCNCKSMSNTSLPNNSCRLVLFDETVVMPMAKIWSDIISKVLTYGVGQSMLEWNVKRQFDLRSGSHYTSTEILLRLVWHVAIQLISGLTMFAVILTLRPLRGRILLLFRF